MCVVWGVCVCTRVGVRARIHTRVFIPSTFYNSCPTRQNMDTWAWSRGIRGLEIATSRSGKVSLQLPVLIKVLCEPSVLAAINQESAGWFVTSYCEFMAILPGFQIISPARAGLFGAGLQRARTQSNEGTGDRYWTRGYTRGLSDIR